MEVQFEFGGKKYHLTAPDGEDPEQVKHSFLLGIPQYQWLSFRRSLILSAEYQLAVALAMGSNAIAVADAKIAAAIDACATHGALPEEVAAFQSALALYLSVLPQDGDGPAIRDRILTLCESHNIATGIEE